jgi:hypothetical protein
MPENRKSVPDDRSICVSPISASSTPIEIETVYTKVFTSMVKVVVFPRGGRLAVRQSTASPAA